MLQGLNELLCLRGKLTPGRHLAQSLRLGHTHEARSLLFSVLPALFLLFLMVDGSYPHSHTSSFLILPAQLQALNIARSTVNNIPTSFSSVFLSLKNFLQTCMFPFSQMDTEYLVQFSDLKLIRYLLELCNNVLFVILSDL